MDAGVGGEVPAVFGAALAIADRISCECLGNKPPLRAESERRRGRLRRVRSSEGAGLPGRFFFGGHFDLDIDSNSAPLDACLIE